MGLGLGLGRLLDRGELRGGHDLGGRLGLPLLHLLVDRVEVGGEG